MKHILSALSSLVRIPPLRHGRLLAVAIACVSVSTTPAEASTDELANLINAYRAAPGACGGQGVARVPALAPEPLLSRIRVGPGTFLESALKRAGYLADHAEAISVTGPLDAKSAMNSIQEKYCRTLLSEAFTAVGTLHDGNEWQVVLARPLLIPALPDLNEAGQQILSLVNAARSQPRVCGDQSFGAAGPLRWSPVLARAALAHSSELATHHYFSHVERNGSTPAERITRAGYAWSRVGENIASGQRSPAEAVQSWLDSPGHCANIMNPGFTEMGAAYAVNPGNENHTAYWTQEFAQPR